MKSKTIGKIYNSLAKWHKIKYSAWNKFLKTCYKTETWGVWDLNISA